MVPKPLQDSEGEAGWCGGEGGGQPLQRRRLPRHLGESLGASAVCSPGGMRWIGQEDTDASDHDRSLRHAFVMAALHEGGGNQEWFERVSNTGVVAEVQQRVDVVLDVPAVLAEEAVAEVFEASTTAG
jgi:hypothetical protein